MRAVRLGLAVGGLLVLVSAAAQAQVNQIHPRVLIMVDTSGSMSEHFTDNNTTGGDGSIYYQDNVLTRSFATDKNLSLYVGQELGTISCTAPPSTLSSYDGINSRMYAAKAAVTNVINGSGDIDWGLMRYTGTVCGTGGSFTARTPSNCATQCRAGACDANGHCPCTNDGDCGRSTASNYREFCVGGVCGSDSNLCASGADYGNTDTRGQQSCGYHNNDVPLTFAGSCGTNGGTGSAACATPLVCYSDADCGGGVGQCQALAGSAAQACSCNGFTCPAGYSCSAAKTCVWSGN
jgi:hypothetical protein